MKTILLLDGDIIAWRTAKGVEKKTIFGHIVTVHTDMSQAKNVADAKIAKEAEGLKGDQLVLCASDPARHYFRHDIWPDYKAGRDAGPIAIAEVKAYLTEQYDYVWRPCLEGDDIMGILSTANMSKYAGKKVIVSQDKDMLTIPGYLSRDGRTVQHIDEREADWNHMLQTLVGDRVDGFAGCPKVGEGTAPKVLKRATDEDLPLWDVVVARYEKAKMTEEDALVQARLARILRASDYDFKNKQVKLWEPR